MTHGITSPGLSVGVMVPPKFVEEKERCVKISEVDSYRGLWYKTTHSLSHWISNEYRDRNARSGRAVMPRQCGKALASFRQG